MLNVKLVWLLCTLFGVVFLFVAFGEKSSVAEKAQHGGKAPQRELNDGNKIPTVALGTGDSKDKEKVGDAVKWAIEAGYRHIDTASIYENEKQIGEALANAIDKVLVKREDMFITTKLWNDMHARDQVIPALKESLKNLKLKYVDLYLMHTPIAQKANGEYENIDYLETWFGMQDAKAMGLTKSIGVSNFKIPQLDKLIAHSNVTPAVIEIEMNPTLTQETLISHCDMYDIAVMAYSPLGFMVPRKRADAPPPRIDDPILKAIGDKYNKTTVQVILRYIIQKGVIPIPRSTKKSRINENIDLFDFELTNYEVLQISKFKKDIKVLDLSGWADSPKYPYNDQ